MWSHNFKYSVRTKNTLMEDLSLFFILTAVFDVDLILGEENRLQNSFALDLLYRTEVKKCLVRWDLELKKTVILPLSYVNEKIMLFNK